MLRSSSSYHFPHNDPLSATDKTDYTQAPLRASQHPPSSTPSKTSSTERKVTALLYHVSETESEYIDDLYLLFSYLGPKNPLYGVVQQIIDASSAPYLEYVSRSDLIRIDQEDPIDSAASLHEWVSSLISPPLLQHTNTAIGYSHRTPLLKIH